MFGRESIPSVFSLLDSRQDIVITEHPSCGIQGIPGALSGGCVTASGITCPADPTPARKSWGVLGGNEAGEMFLTHL